MFGASNFFERYQTSRANEMGFDTAVLGLDKINPFQEGSVDHKQWEWGYQEGLDTMEETVHAHHISNEYESYM